MVEDAVVAAQTRRRHQSHQLFGLGRQRAFQVSVAIDVIEALDQKIVRLVDIGIEPRPGFDEPARRLALIGDVFFRKK